VIRFRHSQRSGGERAPIAMGLDASFTAAFDEVFRTAGVRIVCSAV
jgi:hypothetical protein